MYGSRSYGTSSYGSISKVVSRKVILPDTLSLSTTLYSPTVEITKAVGLLSLTTTLHAPSVITTEREIIIKVNDVDVSSQIDWESVVINNNLFSSPNTAGFRILKNGLKSYTPSESDEIDIYDTGVKVFAGNIIGISEERDEEVDYLNLELKDWSIELEAVKIAETYSNETVENIIADIFTDSALSSYDETTYVSDTTNIQSIPFDNISVTQCLDQLASLSGKIWYVSPDKEIFFQSKSGIPATFDLSETSKNFDYNTLILYRDFTQLKNHVTIKGKGIAPVTVQDATSQSTYGLYEYYEQDENITSIAGATQKANAILAAYKDEIKKVSFRTQLNGLFTGQQIDIVLPNRGINETLNIERVTYKSKTPFRFEYDIECTSQRLGGIEDLWKDATDPVDITPSLGDQGNLQDIQFTSIDYQTIQWSSGTITLADGTQYSISSKASQSLTGSHIIYFDPDTSETVLQISTTFTDGMGARKIPLAYAIKNPVSSRGATILPVSSGGKIQIDGGTNITENSIITDNIAANAITVNELAANSVNASKIVANTITSDKITTGEFITLSAQIKDAIITTAKIDNLAVTNAKIANLAVDNAKISSLDAAKINTGFLSADRIQAGTITATKLNVSTLSAISANCGTITAGTITGATFNANGGSGTDISITNDGYIRFKYGGGTQSFIYSDSSGNVIWDADNSMYIEFNSDGGSGEIFQILEDGGPAFTIAGNKAITMYDDLTVAGTLSKGSGSFKIDHPLKPKTHYLFHSFVESPDMLNIYKGRSKTKNKKAIVKLPDYFEALNKDFEYQLTPIKSLSRLGIKKEVKDNKFEVMTDEDCEFSWVVTGVRKDRFALSKPIIPVVKKDVEGYVHPELWK